ncbi:MAG: cyclodeaminase/cyclohydrolase family protein [Chloroflexota bacterium]|nr:cyclodeaminase/cyclohydrolase family protein [Chloroflexota bacterium]
MIRTFDLDNFLTTLASGSPTPGGGSASALAGALGASLAAMVGRLTVGRKRYASVEAEMTAVVAQADALRSHLTQLADDDAAAYSQVSAAYRLPKSSDQEISIRDEAIQDALKEASLTPLQTMEACVETLELLLKVSISGNVNALTDASVGALIARAGLAGASLNVMVNLADIEDEQFVRKCQTRADELQEQGASLEESVTRIARERA